METDLAKQSIQKSINYFISAIEYRPDNYTYYLSIETAYRRASRISHQLNDYVSEVQHLNEAIRNLTIAIELNPDSAVAYRQRGFCNCMLKKYDEALIDFNISKRLNINDPRLYYYLGILFDRQEEPEKALENYRHCIELKKDYYEAYNNIGHVIHEKIKYTGLKVKQKRKVLSEAIENYSLAIEYSGGSHVDAYLNLGRVYDDLRDFPKAIEFETIAINNSPKNSDAYAARAQTFYNSLKYADAEKDLLAALKLKPGSEKVIKLLALVNQQIGAKKRKKGVQEESSVKFEKSISYFDQLSKSQDESKRILAQVGKAITLKKMGKERDAYAILHELYADNPLNPKVLSAIEYLNKDEDILEFLSVLLELIKEFI